MAIVTMIGSLVVALRPHQWVKNLFVAAPVVFARRMYDGAADLRTAAAVASFCFLSSAVYLLNDVVDIEKDRSHPVKRLRPIAAGQLSVRAAQIVAAVLIVLSAGVGLALGWPFLAAAASYLLLNRLYSVWWKRVPFVDVACLSTFFLIRVVAGSVAIPVPPSSWLLACTFLLASLIGFGKRAHELRLSGASGEAQRDVLGRYSLPALRRLLAALAAGTITTYLLYTQSQHALDSFGTRRLGFTVPFVAFGIFRFVAIAQRSDPRSPTDMMLRDLSFMANLALYAAAVLIVIYAAG